MIKLLSCDQLALSSAALTSFMYIVATKTLSLIADNTPFATKNRGGWVSALCA